MEVKTKINKWELIKHKIFLHSKGNHKQKDQPTEWEKIFANCETNKELVSKIYK